MTTDGNRTERRDLSTHVLGASVAMIGVSTTLIGLVKVAKGDQWTAVATMFFLTSAIASYLSIRFADRPDLSQRCESIADRVVICGLIGISAIAALFAHEVI